MVAGGLADAVGREVAAQQGGGGGGEAKKTLEFSIAAERVRYRFREEA